LKARTSKITKYTLPLGYQVTIENHSKDSVQLTSRHWEIYDSLNNIEIVDEGLLVKNQFKTW
jgi:ApaG protein